VLLEDFSIHDGPHEDLVLKSRVHFDFGASSFWMLEPLGHGAAATATATCSCGGADDEEGGYGCGSGVT